MRKTRPFIVLIMILSLPSLLGCDFRGTIIPSARYEVTFQKSMGREELYLRFGMLAEKLGYPAFRGRLPDSDQTYPREIYSGQSYRWFRGDQRVGQEDSHHLTVQIYDNVELLDRICFKYTNDLPVHFELVEWKELARILDALSQEFPDAITQTLRHPAYHTLRENHTIFAEVSGIGVGPEDGRDSQGCPAYEEAQNSMKLPQNTSDR